MPAYKDEKIRTLLTYDDKRGIASEILRHSDPLEVVHVAKAIVRTTASSIIIVTGFFVRGKPETDGPLGAVLLGFALHSLGWRVSFASAPECLSLIRKCANFPAGFIEFPLMPEEESKRFADKVLHHEKPGCLISIEVCGRTAEGQYLNMKGEDIESATPRLDCLFLSEAARGLFSIGIGDGGNEVGFGSVSPGILSRCGVHPCVVNTKHLLVASVSNWAAYALLAFISIETGHRFFPDSNQEQRLLKCLVDNGAVDGFSGRRICRVDGRAAHTSQLFLRNLEGIYATLQIRRE